MSYAPAASDRGRDGDEANPSDCTVLGFGYLLLAMALCQARNTRARAAYVAVFIVLFAFQIPVFALSGGNSDAAQSGSFFAADDASDESN
jgi:hypothetical protein